MKLKKIMKKEYPKRYNFISPTIFNSIPTWVESPDGIWIRDRSHIINVSQYQKRKIIKKIKQAKREAPQQTVEADALYKPCPGCGGQGQASCSCDRHDSKD